MEQTVFVSVCACMCAYVCVCAQVLAFHLNHVWYPHIWLKKLNVISMFRNIGFGFLHIIVESFLINIMFVFCGINLKKNVSIFLFIHFFFIFFLSFFYYMSNDLCKQVFCDHDFCPSTLQVCKR